jgi:hypothetical protein
LTCPSARSLSSACFPFLSSFSIAPSS